MFRKRKNPTPGFRIPVPFNPLTGKRACFVPDRKRFCVFGLTEEMETTDATVTGTILWQYGPGSPHQTLDVTIHNMPTSTEGTYVFEGANGAIGYAFWDTGVEWYVFQMECPA